MAATRAVLGIDAAWTTANPSGVALLIKRMDQWEVASISASYDEFISGEYSHSRRGSKCDVLALIAAAEDRAQCAVNLVAVDMPLAHTSITARRVSDNVVSRLYGAKGCGTHSPSAVRPGKISDDLRTEFQRLGYALALRELHLRSLCEVYPHPALLALTKRDRRLEYKESKRRKYWPGATPTARLQLLFDVWAEIIAALSREVHDVDRYLPLPEKNARGYALKAFEDRLDAVVCAWIGVCVLEGRAKAYGDDDSAIWIPD